MSDALRYLFDTTSQSNTSKENKSPINLLICVPERLGMRGSLLKWCYSFLAGILLCVKISAATSESFADFYTVGEGIVREIAPQGYTVLCFINNIKPIINFNL